MADAKQLMISIIIELTAIQGKPPRDLVEKGDFPIPSMMPAGNDKSIYTNKTIERAIAALAQELMKEDATLATRFTTDEWRSVVRNAIGPALAVIDLDDDIGANSSNVLTAIRAMLATEAVAVE